MELKQSHSVRLNDGHLMPMLGFGTYAPDHLWTTFFRPEFVRPALERSLKKLQLDYVDVFIIHNPLALKSGEELLPKDASGNIIFDTVDLRDTWEALEKYKDAGLAKSIGVSNFNHKLLELILNKPGLKYTSISPSATRMDPDSPYILEEPTLKSIAKKHNRSPGQVALRYQLQ
ncbi:hypothetical protein H8959_011292 [Pygathrix nigripes]